MSKLQYMALSPEKYEGLALYLRNYIDSGLESSHGLRQVLHKLNTAEIDKYGWRTAGLTSSEIAAVASSLSDIFSVPPVTELGGHSWLGKPINKQRSPYYKMIEEVD